MNVDTTYPLIDRLAVLSSRVNQAHAFSHVFAVLAEAVFTIRRRKGSFGDEGSQSTALAQLQLGCVGWHTIIDTQSISYVQFKVEVSLLKLLVSSNLAGDHSPHIKPPALPHLRTP